LPTKVRSSTWRLKAVNVSSSTPAGAIWRAGQNPGEAGQPVPHLAVQSAEHGASAAIFAACHTPAAGVACPSGSGSSGRRPVSVSSMMPKTSHIRIIVRAHRLSDQPFSTL